MENPLLEVRNLAKSFGGVQAVTELSFDVEKGTVTGLIGPNGAGKTTVLDLISGVQVPDSGSVIFEGQDVTAKAPNVLVERGISRTFQLVRVFPGMSLIDNVVVGMYTRIQSGFFAQALSLPKSRKETRILREQAFEYLKLVKLGENSQVLAENIPLGAQKRLQIARSLATQPKLLLLDEPAGGLNDVERKQLAEVLLSLKEQGLTILLVEHNMDLVMNICDFIVVINYGRKLAEDVPSQITKNSEVVSAYLGGD